MKPAFLIFAAAAMLNSCGKPEPGIDEFVGIWKSPPFHELIESAIQEEVIPALREGDFEMVKAMGIGEDSEKLEQLVSLTDEELKAEILSFPQLTMVSFQVGFEIRNEGQFVWFMANDGEIIQRQQMEAEFVVTNEEILVRTGDETEVILIQDGFLRTRNENRGKFPKFIRFYREDP